ncbi:GNAT family N-acetyltransferase [Paeniglutamicibacter cryotolerans]|uniref:GNAT family N-acetyltransferase n=1 Tax=Paeniglutamicibacter cryotolerans TaxID=670079 RepID=UPI0038994A61
MCVSPACQVQGVGGALLDGIRDRATAAGERAIVLLGHAGFYPRFGYVPAIPVGIIASDRSWGESFMALALGGRPLPAGSFRYAGPFGA